MPRKRGATVVNERCNGDPAAIPSAGSFILRDDYNPIDYLRAPESLRWRERTARNIGEQAIFGSSQ